MEEKLRTQLFVGGALVVLVALAAVGYAAAQDANNSTNSTGAVPSGTPTAGHHAGGAGHVCPLDAQNAASTSGTAGASNATPSASA